MESYDPFTADRKKPPRYNSPDELADEVCSLHRTSPQLKIRACIIAVLHDRGLMVTSCASREALIKEIHSIVGRRGGKVAGGRLRQRARDKKLRDEAADPQMQLSLGDRPAYQYHLNL